MLILYGSQGGASKEAARLLEAIIRFGYSENYLCEVHGIYEAFSILEMDDFNIEKIFDLDCIIFICSTHGNGTEPFNMTRFWNTLKKVKQPDILSHLKFTVFGLGDSSYESYNYCSKKLYNLLESLGAKAVLRRGCGDSQDPEGWLQDFKLWGKEFLQNNFLKTQSLESSKPYRIQERNLYNVQLVRPTILTPICYTPETIELEFTIDNYNSFQPGDCLGVLPSNYNLEELVNYFNVNSIQIKHLDFNGIPQITLFSFLHQYLISNKIDCGTEKLNRIGELYKDYSLYYDYIVKPKRTIFETFKDLNIIPSLEFLLQWVPKISYRYFTLTKKDHHYSIVCSVVEFKTSLKESRRGLVSEYLKKCPKLLVCKIGITMANSIVNYYSDKSIVIFYGFRWYKKDCFDGEIKNKDNVKIFYASSKDDNKYVQDVFKENPVVNINEFDIIASGNSRLNKILNNLFTEIYGEKISFYCETW